ncbi:MAG: hypothetical protein ACK5V3_02115 [Bdellovibrionales bacterium]
MKQLALEYFTQIEATSFAFILFLLAFLFQFIRLFLKHQDEHLERAAHLPFEGENHE